MACKLFNADAKDDVSWKVVKVGVEADGHLV